MDSITLSQAIEGFRIHIQAQRLSPNTIRDYDNTLRKFVCFTDGDPLLCEIRSGDIEAFLASFDPEKYKKKTILNYFIALSSLWTWATAEGVAPEHILRRIDPPEPEKVNIIPFLESEVKLLLSACERSRNFIRGDYGRPMNLTLNTAGRNRAIIYTLLDTGVRASELCGARLGDLDLKNNRLTVMGKGSKQRTVNFSPRTAKILWRYLSCRPEEEKRERDPVFPGEDNNFMNRDTLYKLLARIGQRAGVAGVHPHRFRHTFAINFLRNGGNVFALQEALGHSSLDMCKRYLKLSQRDMDEVHRIASPVANWNL